MEGHLEIVRLLNDPRVNPSARDNEAQKWDTGEIITNDPPRVNPVVLGITKLVNMGHPKLVQLFTIRGILGAYDKFQKDLRRGSRGPSGLQFEHLLVSIQSHWNRKRGRTQAIARSPNLLLMGLSIGSCSSSLLRLLL
jgi:hypothetical protein